VQISFESPDLKAVIERLEHVPAGMERTFAQELNGWGEETMTLAKELTPVDTGALRASGVVLHAEPDRLELTLGFGGPAGYGNHGGESNARDVGYALFVHENLAAHHPVGIAKFLELAVIEELPKANSALSRAVDEVFEGLGLA
jgi:hypothetical protein